MVLVARGVHFNDLGLWRALVLIRVASLRSARQAHASNPETDGGNWGGAQAYHQPQFLSRRRLLIAFPHLRNHFGIDFANYFPFVAAYEVVKEQ